MERVLRIRLGEYQVVRMPDAKARAAARRAGTPYGGAVYRVVRPDGVELCCGVSWGEVEELIAEDLRRGKRAPRQPKPAGEQQVKAKPRGGSATPSGRRAAPRR
jgi:hypothetical protein